ncbi:MAG: hypothetical protein P0S93_06010 [Candidatus Neptunochlamydia sp.]|nr:hypothetical protein [Candidatus Neptunochlamydia sp.]
MTTLGVEYARKVFLARGDSLEGKRMILLENFTSLIKSSSDFDRKTLFENVRKLLFKGIYDRGVLKVGKPLSKLKFSSKKLSAFNSPRKGMPWSSSH